MESWLMGHVALCFLVLGELGGIGIILWILLPFVGDWLRSRPASPSLLRHQRTRRRPAAAHPK
jgi:hypothetical protein